MWKMNGRNKTEGSGEGKDRVWPLEEFVDTPKLIPYGVHEGVAPSKPTGQYLPISFYWYSLHPRRDDKA